MGTVFAILMGFFGLAGIYAVLNGVHMNDEDPMYFITFSLICLVIASASLFLSVKLYYHG